MSASMENGTIVAAYQMARDIVTGSGYAGEIEWQDSLDFEAMDARSFLREHAYVVLCSGFRQSIVEKYWPDVARLFGDWRSQAYVVADADAIVTAARKHINYPQKWNGIVQAARTMKERGWRDVRDSIVADPLPELEGWPWIGPVTKYHLAKNLGLPLAKPDRHLLRLAAVAGYEDVQEFCGHIARATTDSVPVVDVVLWRFATLAPRYASMFGEWCAGQAVTEAA